MQVWVQTIGDGLKIYRLSLGIHTDNLAIGITVILRLIFAYTTEHRALCVSVGTLGTSMIYFF